VRLERRCRTNVWPLTNDNLNFNSDNVEIEEGNCVFMEMVPWSICALRTVSRYLAKAFAKNSKPGGLHGTVHTALHSYEDMVSETAFDTLP
jgi:hypothetical protein